MIPEDADFVWIEERLFLRKRCYESCGMSETVGGVVVYSRLGNPILRIYSNMIYANRMLMKEEELIFDIIRAYYARHCLEEQDGED